MVQDAVGHRQEFRRGGVVLRGQGGACEGLGMHTLMNDLGTTAGINLRLDSSAVKGILEKSGLSKVGHMDIDHLWL